MTTKNTGGPAFPVAVPVEFQFANDGMTLRDYFAGQAIGAVIKQCCSDRADAPAPLTGGMGDLWSDCGTSARTISAEIKEAIGHGS